uniref:UBX domain-containing protein n=1 Tax=Graphocephala atropunctata TaxID=36148 RepID=A0A1B6M7B8_9HEMI
MDNLDMNLTEEQTDKVLQFQDLTGIDNVTLCRDVLQRHNWDLEVAVQDQLNIREGRPTMFSSDHSPPTVVSDPIPQHVFFSPPARYNPGNNSSWGLLRYVVTAFFHFCYDTLTSILGLTYRLLFRDPRGQVTDPVGDVMRFLHQFEESFGSIHPVFYQGSYGQALTDAKQELRFLVVYLHQDNNKNCNNFCRMTLCNETLVQYINSTNMLFWACSINSGEGYRVSQSLQENSHPFLAVIVLKENRMTIVGRQEGPVDAQELVGRLQMIIAANEASLVAARADRVERSFNQTLRRQQDEAYMQSLLADQEKERLKCQELERRESEARELREVVEAERRRKEDLRRQKIELVNLVPTEPSPTDPEAVCVVFKMPNGCRLERRFLQSHTLEDVFHFVFCHPESPDEFEITTNFPKRTLDCKGALKSQSLREWGLRKGEVLFVYDLES